jgi:hypothetical protein
MSDTRKHKVVNFIKNASFLFIALFIGALANGKIIELSPSLIPPPQGADFTTEAGLKAAAELMEPKHFIMPFLAHALGTLVSAIVLLFFFKERQSLFIRSLIVGGIFFLGGLSMVFMIPSPKWFILIDLGLAYFPMALIPFWIKYKKLY